MAREGRQFSFYSHTKVSDFGFVWVKAEPQLCADIFARRSIAAHKAASPSRRAVLEKAENINPDPQIRLAALISSLRSANPPTAAEGEKTVNAVRFALPPPIIDWAGPMPYPALQTLFDGLFPKDLQSYWKGDFVKALPDTAIDV